MNCLNVLMQSCHWVFLQLIQNNSQNILKLLFTEKLRFHCWNRSEEVWRCKKLDFRPSFRMMFLCERCACTGFRIPKLFQTFTIFRKRVYNTYDRTWWQYEASKQVVMSFSRKLWENLKYFGFGLHLLDYYRLCALVTFVSSSATHVATIYTSWDLLQRIVSSFQPYSSSPWSLGHSCNPTVHVNYTYIQQFSACKNLTGTKLG